MTEANPLEGAHVLMIYAHCDDEIVCGWPVFQNPAIRKTLLIASSDRHNESRRWCSHRGHVTQDLCRSLDVEAQVLDYGSDFYRLNHRDGSLSKFEDRVLQVVDSIDCDFIMTHNPFGEYGHLDHRFLSDLVIRTARVPVITTDIILPSDWTRTPPTNDLFSKLYFRNKIGSETIDLAFYTRVQRFYETRGAWTWSTPPSESASIYRI